MFRLRGVLGALICFCPLVTHALPEQGKWNFIINQTDAVVGEMKSLFAGTPVFINVTCADQNTRISVSWNVIVTRCWNEYLSMVQEEFSVYVHKHWSHSTNSLDGLYGEKKLNGFEGRCRDFSLPLIEFNMTGFPPGVDASNTPDEGDRATESRSITSSAAGTDIKPKTLSRSRRSADRTPQCVIKEEAIYLVFVHVHVLDQPGNSSVNVQHKPITVFLQMGSERTGFLSAADWPNLPFYAIMTVIYLVYFMIWMVVCFVRWRELLRIQYWICAVIALGFIEKVAFLAEYDYLDRHGVSMYGSVIFAEIVSCAKRALARILVIIISVGFGITKPRLGPLLKRVIAIGFTYFILAAIESCSRALRSRNQLSSDVVMATVILCVMDSAIFWWVFASLSSTIKTLRLRGNQVKLMVFRHLSYTLAFCVLVSIAFILWSLRYHKWDRCLSGWRHLWTDEAAWHVLFSVILAVIMVLWRPDMNNQRYAFTPLLDPGDDDDDEDEIFAQETFHGVKLRTQSGSSSSRERNTRHNSDEDLRWVEENIPSSVNDAAFPVPIIDSDEETQQVKMEVNKMQ